MSEPKPSTEQGWPVFELWQKYEDIAMHFNDLLIRLRTQALGAIAALTTIIGANANATISQLVCLSSPALANTYPKGE